MPTATFELGILFDVAGLGGGFYGRAAYEIFFANLDPRQLAGCTIHHGDALGISSDLFCICVQTTDPAQIAYVRAALAAVEAPGLRTGADRLLSGEVTRPNHLVEAGRIDFEGRFQAKANGMVGEGWGAGTPWSIRTGEVQGGYRSLRWISGWTMLVWAMFPILLIAPIIGTWLGYARLTAAPWPQSQTGSSADSGLLSLVVEAERTYLRTEQALLGLSLVAIPILIAFLFRVRRNLPALGARDLAFAPHWTVTGFLVPFLNLVRPYQVVREIWDATAATRGPATKASRLLPRLWWEAWLANVALNAGVVVILAEHFDPLAIAGLLLGMYSFRGVLAILTILLVRNLTVVQEARASGAPARPRAFDLPASVGYDAAVLAVAALAIAGLHVGMKGRVDEAVAGILAAARGANLASAPASAEARPDGAAPSARPMQKEIPVDAPIALDDLGGIVGGVERLVHGGASDPDLRAARSGEQILRVSGGITPPEKLSGPRPEYTSIARNARIQGVVILQAVIDEEGRVTELEILKGLPMGLDEAAMAAVRKWRYRPAQLEGRPVSVYFTISVSFRLDSAG